MTSAKRFNDEYVSASRVVETIDRVNTRVRDLVAMGPLTWQPIDDALLTLGLAYVWDRYSDGTPTMDATKLGFESVGMKPYFS